MNNFNLSSFFKGNSRLIAMICAILIMLLSIFFSLPEFFLDILIGFNLTLSLIILLTSMSSSQALDFDAFPSLLLFTTLFRVCLNIATTRSILINGSAGKLIESFGSIAIGGNAIVGIIIFIIVTIVNMIVIVKGSERISEIAARFTLDAMQGKQIAVESEFNQGLITEEEAKIKKKNIQRESDFFGSMDGATKFVKGDSIAGLIITCINIVAGVSFGMFRDSLSISESLSTYAILTVGDGLLSAIPSLIIAISTGVMVTRPFSKNDMGSEIIGQLFKNPLILYIAGFACFCFGLLPGVNILTFGVMGSSFIYLGYKISKSLISEKEKEKVNSQVVQDPNNVVEYNNYSEYYNQEIFEIEIGMGLVSLVRKSQGGQLEDKLELIKRQLLKDLGFLVPKIRIRDNINLEPYTYCINVNGLMVDSYTIELDRFLAIPSDDDIALQGIPTKEPTYNFDALWIEEHQLKEARKMQYHIADGLTVMATHFTSIAKKYAHEMLTRESVKKMLDIVKEENPTIVEELIPNVLSLGQVQKVLSNLLREGISIKNLVLILESLADNAVLTKDTSLLTELVREKIKKQIISSIDTEDIYYISFNSSTEEIISKSLQENHLFGMFLSLKPEHTSSLLSQLQQYSSDILSLGKTPVIICSSAIRFYLNRFIEQHKLEFIKVISYDEASISQSPLYNKGVVNIEP